MTVSEVRLRAPVDERIRMDWIPAAAAVLELGKRIEIEPIDSRPTLCAGAYCPEAEAHVVYVSTRQSAEEMSRTLWHELAHAAQCEHWHGGDGHLYHRDYLESRSANPIHERHATACERFHDAFFALAV